MTVRILFYTAVLLQALAILYAIFLMKRRQGLAAWLWLLGSMLSMMTWRIVVATGVTPPPFFNPLIAIWGSTCLCFGMFFFGREIARRERAESERDALLESERAAREQAERAARVKDQFLATLSHELRTPLTAIIGWCDIYRLQSARTNGNGWDGAAEAIETIERNARLQAKLVEDLIDVTRIGAGTLRLDAKPVTLASCIAAAIDAVRPLAQAKRLHVTAAVEDSLQVAGDATRLQQVVLNLLNNSIKFTPEDGTVRVACVADRGSAVLSVEDTGEGIAPDFLPHVFTRFRQSDAAISRRRGGLGLGLAIVKSLVELHGGTVHAHSDGPGRGATFTVRLPLHASHLPSAPAPAADEPAAPATAPAAAAAPLSGLRILVVEDERDVRTVVQRILESHGAAVVAAESADEGALRLREQPIDLIVSDIGMPGEDGYAFLRRLRSDGIQTPAVALTAYARDADRGRAIDSGFQAHVPKPVNATELVNQAIRLTNHRADPPRPRPQRAEPV